MTRREREEWEHELKCGLYRAIGAKRKEYREDEGLVSLLDALEGMLSVTEIPAPMTRLASKRIRPGTHRRDRRQR